MALSCTKKKYKICWVCTPLGTKGGTIKRLKLWAKYIDRNKFDITFIFYGERNEVLKLFANYPNVEIKYTKKIRNSVTSLLPGVYKLHQEFKQNHYDLIHSMYVWSDILVGLTSKITPGLKILSYSAGTYLDLFVHLPLDCKIYTHPLTVVKKAFRIFGARLLFRLIKDQIECFIVVSEHNKKDIIKNGFPAPKIYVNKIGLDFEEFQIAKNKVNTNKALTFGWAGRIGRFKRAKGLGDVIEAFHSLVKDGHYDLKLLVVANEGSDFWKNEVFKIGLRHSIKFIDWIENISEFFNKIDVFLLPSINEGTPRSILEAYYHNVPVIATNVGGIPEILEHNKTGFLVPYGNPNLLKEKMEYFINNPDEVKRMGINAREYVVKNHDVKTEVRKLEGIYLRIIEEKL